MSSMGGAATGGMGSMFSGAGGLVSGAGKGIFGGGSDDKYAEDAWKMSQQEYWNQQFRNLNDPFQKAGLRQLKNQSQMDLMGMGKALGNRGADTSSRGLQDALASRGGGNLASALSMGAQARVGAGLQGLQTGFGMQQQASSALTGAAQARLNLMNQLYGALTGVSTGTIGAGAQVQSAQIGGNAQIWSSLFSNMGKQGSSSGSGGGGSGG